MSAPTHVIMTRFNLATPGREAAIRTDPDWLAVRFDLFRRYCLPSVAAQEGASFRWLIFFDRDTPARWKAEIGRLRSIFPFDPYFTPLFPEDGWRDAVLGTIRPAGAMLLTTRLDNDDALAADFCARVQAAASGDAPVAINLRHGLIRQGRAVHAIDHPRNAFFSLLERRDGRFRTAPAIPHMDLPRHAEVRQVGGAPGWLQLVHGGNVSNRLRGRRIDPARTGARFGGEGLDGTAAPTAGERAADALLGPIRTARDALSAMRRPGPGGARRRE